MFDVSKMPGGGKYNLMRGLRSDSLASITVLGAILPFCSADRFCASGFYGLCGRKGCERLRSKVNNIRDLRRFENKA